MPDRFGDDWTDTPPPDPYDQPTPHIDSTLVEACDLCDERGYRGLQVCTHVDYAAAARRARPKIRAALSKEAGK